MKKIEPNEASIIGHNIFAQGKIIGDEVTQRIFDLVNSHLIKLGHDQSGWDTVYQDPSDGRFWELIYPDSELQGGGPPSLVLISRDAAALKYKI